MSKTILRFILGLASGVLLLAYQNCSKISVSDLTKDSTNAIVQDTPTTPPTCTDGKDITKPTKIFLVVDASASNYTDPQGQWIGTDDRKVWRSKVINAILTKYGNNPHISFGLVSFKGNEPGNEITAHIHAQDSKEPIFTNNMAIVKAAVNDFMNFPEGPYTPYPAAVRSAYDVIKADLDANPRENATYAVIMLTDGVPSAGIYDLDRHPDALTVASKDTQSIMDLSPGMIHFNGVYYYNDSNIPKAGNDRVLKQIVQTGNGVFLTANTQPEYDFNIDTILKFEPAQCQ